MRHMTKRMILRSKKAAGPTGPAFLRLKMLENTW